MLSGLITLPMVLSFLTKDEIALNYVFLNIISFVILFDFGFSPQFSKNVAFAFGGAQTINTKGYCKSSGNHINYCLIKAIIETARFLYLRISLIVLLLLSTLGTLYIYKITNRFCSVNNSLIIWLLFVIVETFDFYYKFYIPLMLGKGQIAEVNRIDIISNFIKIIITASLLFLDLRLWAVIIGMSAKVVCTRLLSVYYFYYKDGLNMILLYIKIDAFQKRVILQKIWYNAKRTGAVQLASFASTQLGFFYSGIFLDSDILASYGLLMQLVGIISSVSLSLGYSSLPLYSQFLATNNKKAFYESYYFSNGMFYLIYICGGSFLIFAVPYILPLIKSNVSLPSMLIVSIYILNKFLEGQHCLAICCISSKNIVYDLESAIIIGIISIISLYVGLRYFNMGLLELVLIQFLVQVAYPNWKWPYELCREFRINYRGLIYNSIHCVLMKSNRSVG